MSSVNQTSYRNVARLDIVMSSVNQTSYRNIMRFISHKNYENGNLKKKKESLRGKVK